MDGSGRKGRSVGTGCQSRLAARRKNNFYHMMVLGENANQMPYKTRLVLTSLVSRVLFVKMDQEKTASGDE